MYFDARKCLDKDSSDQIKACNALISEREENDYNEAVELLNSGRYEEALSAFKELYDYKDIQM